MVKREITRDLEMVAPEISKIVNEMIGKADDPSSSG